MSEACTTCEHSEGTVPAGDLAQWREEARRIILGIASCIASPPSALPHLQRLQAHLAAMPAQPVNAELLGAAKFFDKIACVPWGCRNAYAHNERLCAPCRLSAAIAQAEKGAAG